MTITARDLWNFSESLNRPTVRIADAWNALGNCYPDHRVNDPNAGQTAGTLGLVQEALQAAERELQAAQEAILAKSRALEKLETNGTKSLEAAA